MQTHWKSTLFTVTHILQLFLLMHLYQLGHKGFEHSVNTPSDLNNIERMDFDFKPPVAVSILLHILAMVNYYAKKSKWSQTSRLTVIIINCHHSVWSAKKHGLAIYSNSVFFCEPFDIYITSKPLDTMPILPISSWTSKSGSGSKQCNIYYSVGDMLISKDHDWRF